MMRTQKEIESMSDLQLNFKASCVSINGTISPCNNWNDCGNLIDELNIDLQHDQVGSGLHFAMDGFGDILSKHKNIKRAVTIVYILIKQQ